MRSLFILAACAALVSATPWQFYGADQSSTTVPAKPKRTAAPEPVDYDKRTLIVKRDDVMPEFLLKRSPELVKRTQSPTSGEDANKCGTQNNNWVCGTGNAGPCCSINGWCGSNSYYCGGGCQNQAGSCVTPWLLLQYDADEGDMIWDVTSDNVFDAEVGDGVAYYGALPSGGWPN